MEQILPSYQAKLQEAQLSLSNEIEWVFPFEGMAIGDSFFIPTLKPSPIIYAIESGAKRAGVKIRAFTTMKDGCMGVRCWRLAQSCNSSALRSKSLTLLNILVSFAVS